MSGDSPSDESVPSWKSVGFQTRLLSIVATCRVSVDPRSPGPSYHIVSRGNNKQPIFDDALRELFPLQLDIVRRRFDWEVYASALMTNHFHLVLKIGDAGLSNGMRQLNTRFALASNAGSARINHCVGERFYSRQITSEHQLFASIRYTLWNPARAGSACVPPTRTGRATAPRPASTTSPEHSACAAAPLLRP